MADFEDSQVVDFGSELVKPNVEPVHLRADQEEVVHFVPLVAGGLDVPSPP